ncbi:MAG: NUDIX domain-containing protein [Endomicrobium sp.]|nr:NUDIX domain-containing protein [Endomicrobium sp.]
MIKEFSCGSVIYKMQNDNPLFLLVNSRRNRKWGFPKGHIKKSETEIETVRREIFEETGIKDIKFVKNYRKEDIYMIERDSNAKRRIVEKHSIYFLCLAFEEFSNFDENEISEVRWVDVEYACTLLSFDSQKEILKCVYNLVMGG